MGEKIGSGLCETGFHMDCDQCPCVCHPRSGRAAPVWDATVSTVTGCRGTTWTADRDSAA